MASSSPYSALNLNSNQLSASFGKFGATAMSRQGYRWRSLHESHLLDRHHSQQNWIIIRWKKVNLLVIASCDFLLLSRATR